MMCGDTNDRRRDRGVRKAGRQIDRNIKERKVKRDKAFKLDVYVYIIS
jgi:hypothetical protein